MKPDTTLEVYIEGQEGPVKFDDAYGVRGEGWDSTYEVVSRESGEVLATFRSRNVKRVTNFVHGRNALILIPYIISDYVEGIRLPVSETGVRLFHFLLKSEISDDFDIAERIEAILPEHVHTALQTIDVMAKGELITHERALHAQRLFFLAWVETIIDRPDWLQYTIDRVLEEAR